MNSKFYFSWLAYVVITFAMGFVWHLILFKKMYQDLGIFSRIDDPIIPLGLASMLIQGLILAYLYPMFPSRSNMWIEGLVFGLVTGAFIASSAVIAEAAKQRVSSLSTWLILESTYYTIQFALSGIAMGLIHGKKI